MEMQSFINFLTALFLPPAVIPIGGREVQLCVPSSLAVAHGGVYRSAAIAPRLDFILSPGGAAGRHANGPAWMEVGKGARGTSPSEGTGQGGVNAARG